MLKSLTEQFVLITQKNWRSTLYIKWMRCTFSPFGPGLPMGPCGPTWPCGKVTTKSNEILQSLIKQSTIFMQFMYIWTLYRTNLNCNCSRRIWRDHHKTLICLDLNSSFLVICVCLGLLSCWKVNFHPRLKIFAERFSFIVFLYSAPSILPLAQIYYSPEHDFGTTVGILFYVLQEFNFHFMWLEQLPLHICCVAFMTCNGLFMFSSPQ